MSKEKPPELFELLRSIKKIDRPIAFVLAGHNGSGKSTLWHDRLAPIVQMPLINADRLIMSILPEPGKDGHLIAWASRLRDQDSRWQKLAQDGVAAFQGLVTDRKMAFAVETVFSHWKPRPDGSIESKVDTILSLQEKGYFVVLVFVGLATVNASIMRVAFRKSKGGHDVPRQKLVARFPRTQKAVGAAAPLADMTLMFDNSLDPKRAFSLARVQRANDVLYDCRDDTYAVPRHVRQVAAPWLERVSGAFDG